MELVTALVAAGLALAAGSGLAFAQTARGPRPRSWRAAAEQAGLTEIEEGPGGGFSGAALRGRSGPLGVRIEHRRLSGQEPYRTLIAVEGLGHSLSLHRVDPSAVPARDGEIEIGSPNFDGAHCLQGLDGSSAVALALLDAETRRQVTGLLRGSVRGKDVRAELRDGVLQVWAREHGLNLSTHHFTQVLAGTLEIAQRLVAPRDFAARIAENLRDEPEPGVRRQGIAVLAHEFSHHPAAREVLRAACTDPSDELRLQAAAALGAEGHATLRALVASKATADARAARALLALSGSRGLPPEQAEAELRRALARRRPETVLACVEALGRDSAAAGAASEALLLPFVRGGDPLAMLAAIQALGRIGTIAALAPLREEAPFWSREMRHAAHQAIAEIQARLGEAAPGQLTLAASGEAGTLSLPPDQPGQLSLTDDGPKPT